MCLVDNDKGEIRPEVTPLHSPCKNLMQFIHVGENNPGTAADFCPGIAGSVTVVDCRAGFGNKIHVEFLQNTKLITGQSLGRIDE